MPKLIRARDKHHAPIIQPGSGDSTLTYFNLLRLGAGPRKILFLARHAFAGRHEEEALRGWLKVFVSRFFDQQYKRSMAPDGPKVGSVSLSPRGDWRMPSDASKAAWLAELE